jgi:hypothetical protein
MNIFKQGVRKLTQLFQAQKKVQQRLEQFLAVVRFAAIGG